MKVTAIVPAAGFGKRLGLKAKKPFVTLNGKPILYYAIKALNSSRMVSDIIVAAEEGQIRRVEELIRKFRFGKVRRIVAGGATRSESVQNCIEAMTSETDVVLIHDAARPLVSAAMIDGSIKAASRHGGCIVAVPESDTVKIADRSGFVKATPDRSTIFRAQTPQAFRAGILKRAYSRLGREKRVTDDSSVMERAGLKVKIIPGSYRNIKITTKEDLKIAEALL